MSLTPARQRLSTQVLVLQLAIIVLTVAAGFVVSVFQARRELDTRTGQRSLAIARTVAATPDVVRGMSAPDPAAVIDPIAERIRRATGAAFIVVANRDGIRYSHPDPKRIGTSLLHDPGEDVSPVLAGHTFVGQENGSLGRSMRAKVPVRDTGGRVIGLVSVGVLETRVSSELLADLPGAAIPPAIGLALGTLGAFLLARRVKRQTFGLEPKEIAALLEQREAMLHGIREGAVAVDPSGRLTLVNDEAGRLIGLSPSAVGRQLCDVVPPGRLRDVLSGQVAGRDEVVLVEERILVVNRMPVQVRGRAAGAIVTVRDRTELDALLHELDDVRSLADALRAQEHEFANRLHVIGGLIELERYDEAVQFINQNSRLHQELAASSVGRAGDPILSGLLLGKASIASERGVTLNVSTGGDLPRNATESHDLVTILGNLIDNALDSAGPSGQVDVSLGVSDGNLVVRVHDSGPGIDPALTEEVFRDGFTTKVATGSRRRGLGLALVSQVVRRHGGQIRVDNLDGAVFTVSLPLPVGAPT